MADVILCPHCLSRVEAGKEQCPFCDKSLRNTNPPGTLPYASLLAGRYTVGRHISTDGEGVTYAALENSGGVRVILKEYFPVTLSEGRDTAGAILPKEGKEVLFKTTRMDFADLHRSIMRITPTTGLTAVLDVVETNNTAYAVLEQVGGESLSHYLSEHPGCIPVAQARSMMQAVMEGVAALHKAGLVHRGISPENILLTGSGTARLCGYGTLGLRTEGSELKSRLYEGYSAPEQYSAAEFEGRYTDVYALAAVCYKMVTGQTPVAAPQRKVRDSLESAHSLEAGVPTWFSQVLACALRLDPARRMQTVPELMSALTDPNVANAMFERGDNQISTRKIMAVSLVVIFILAVLLFWSLLGGRSDDKPTPIPTPAENSEEGTDSYEEIETIPDLVGKRYLTEIKDSDLYAGYRIVMTEQNSSEVAQGVVISQDPLAGTLKTEENQIIRLVVSKGPNLVEMPDILGFTQANAIKQLDERGIQYRMQVVENDGTFAEGCVAKTDVVAGTKFDAGKTIVNVFIAGERDDTLVASTASSEEETDSGDSQAE